MTTHTWPWAESHPNSGWPWPHKRSTFTRNGNSGNYLPVTVETIANYDCVLVATNHDAFDYALIQKYAQLIDDSRGVYWNPVPNVVKA